MWSSFTADAHLRMLNRSSFVFSITNCICANGKVACSEINTAELCKSWRYCTCELQWQFFCVDMHCCAFKPICGLGLVMSVLFPSLVRFYKMHQIPSRLGLWPTPRWGSLQRSPNTLAVFKGPTFEGREERRNGRKGRKREGEGKGEVRTGE